MALYVGTIREPIIERHSDKLSGNYKVNQFE